MNTTLKITQIILAILCIADISYGQITIEGYTYESGNRGWLNQVRVDVFDTKENYIQTGFSNIEGQFAIEVPAGQDYVLKANKDLFHELIVNVDSKSIADGEKVFMKTEMRRKPGYLFEITLAEKRESEDVIVDAIKGARIEVYNNTTAKEELVLVDHPEPHFKANLIKGNHYTILIRKEGYLAKRMEAFVDVKGCILCFEGIGKVEPGVSENLTEKNSMGTLLANVEMEKAIEGKKIALKNIYFDLSKWDIRPDAAEELDKAIVFLKDNPELRLELGAHTDVRGTAEDNRALSQKRARSTANYMIENGEINKNRLSYRGYGEAEILNKCKEGVKCSEREHAVNRRTELKILGVMKKRDEDFKTLKQMKFDENKDSLLEEIMNQKQVKVPGGKEEIPVETKMKIEENVTEQVAEEPIIEMPIENLIKVTQTKEDVSNYIERETMLNLENVKMKSFNGFKIVLVDSPVRLSKEHQVIKDNGEILNHYETAEGHHLYMIGNFTDRKKADNFLNSQIKSAYPKAYIQPFENGIRKI